MARLLTKALEHAGHTVELTSRLRSFCAEPDAAHYNRVERTAQSERERLLREWGRMPPDLWFTYHPYYKSPDLIGPWLAREVSMPYVTAEASYSARRNIGRWAGTQAMVADAIALASANICFTDRDRQGLAEAVPTARLRKLPPFIDYPERPRRVDRPSRQLIAVAMMRPGDKMESYRILAQALERLLHLPWTLSLVGDGPSRRDVAAAFASFPDQRIEMRGALDDASVGQALYDAGIYVWPGIGEAFGLAYLEAQAMGLPVAAQAVAGVPEVVKAGETGILTPAGDVEAYAGAISRLLQDPALGDRMGENAYRFVRDERSLPQAAARLDRILREVVA